MNWKQLIFTAAAIALFPSTPALARQVPDDIEHERIKITTSEGFLLAAYISKPANLDGPLPAIFFTQAVSCYSIAPSADRLSMAERVALASHRTLIQVERAGTGNSEGPGCDKLDYDAEVRHYREAFEQLRNHPWVARDNIVIMGSSLGSTTAPLVAQGNPIAGVIVQGAGALTYFERMVHFDRIQLERQAALEPLEIDAEMRRRIAFHRYYLEDKMTPEQIVVEHPHLAGVWESLVGTDAKPHYGRPYAWHWQAAEKNWLAAWATLEIPVMVVFGEYEQFESRHGHRVIVDTINRLRPGTAKWLEIPKAGHGLRIYPDPIAAYAWEGGEIRPESFVDPVAAWLRSIGVSPKDTRSE